MCHAISAATEQNKHTFQCSEKPGQAGKGWGYSGVLMDNSEMAEDVEEEEEEEGDVWPCEPWESCAGDSSK